MKLYLVAAVVLLSCLFEVSKAQCFMGGSCLDDNTGIRYKDGESWKNMDTCLDCSCSQNKRLLKTCVIKDLGLTPTTQTQEVMVDNNLADVVEQNRLFKCKKITDKRVRKLPRERVVKFYTMEDQVSCCSLLFTPAVTEDCVANKLEGQCKYEIVDKVTGGACEGPISMVGK